MGQNFSMNRLIGLFGTLRVNLLFANAFHLDKAKILLSGKELCILNEYAGQSQKITFYFTRYQEALKAQRTSTPAFTFGKLSDGTQPVPSTSFGMAYRNLPPHVQSAKANWQSTWGVSAEGYAW